MGKHDHKKEEDDGGEIPEEDPPKGRTAAIWASVVTKIAAGAAVEAIKRWVLPLVPW